MHWPCSVTSLFSNEGCIFFANVINKHSDDYDDGDATVDDIIQLFKPERNRENGLNLREVFNCREMARGGGLEDLQWTGNCTNFSCPNGPNFRPRRKRSEAFVIQGLYLKGLLHIVYLYHIFSRIPQDVYT